MSIPIVSPSKDPAVDDFAVVIENQERNFSRQYEERFRLGRIEMPVRRDVRAPQHDIQEPVRVFLHAAVEIVIHPQSGRLARAFDEGLKEIARDGLDGGHTDKATIVKTGATRSA